MKYSQTSIQNQWLRKVLHPKLGQKALYSLVYNCFGIRLYYYQIKTLQNMLNPSIPQVLVSYARQAGKSETIAIFLAICPIFYSDINNYVFGPKLEQAKEMSFDRAGSLIHTNKYNLYSGNLLVDKSDRIRFSNNVEIRAVSASLNSEIEGLTTHIIILDEAQNINTFKIRESILPMGSGTNAKIIVVGVPRTMGSYFHGCWKNPLFNKLIFPWEKCLRPKGNLYKEYVLQRREEDPLTFASQYELLWNQDLSTYIPYESWLACELDYKLEEEKGNFWGVDFGMKRDSTVITEGKLDPDTGHIKITNWWELEGIASPEQINYMKDIINPGIELVLCDQSSMGLPFIQFMVEQGLPAQGMNFDMHTKDKLYKFLRNMVQQKKIHWPKKSCLETTRQHRLYSRFIQQCIDLEIEHKSTGLISVHHPEYGTGSTNAHDDFPDSLALLCYASQEYISPSAGFWS